MRRPLVSACLLAAAILGFSDGADAQDRLTLVLDWFVNPDHGPIIVAQQKGLFAAAGLDVEIQSPADPNDPPKLVAAGQADIAVSYQPQLHIQVSEGLPLARIGTLVATPLNSLLVLADDGARADDEARVFAAILEVLGRMSEGDEGVDEAVLADLDARGDAHMRDETRSGADLHRAVDDAEGADLHVRAELGARIDDG